MLELKDVEIDDASWMKPILQKSDFRGSEFTFGNIFVWRNIYHIKVCEYKGFLIVHNNFRSPSFVFPAGEGNLEEVIEQMRACAKSEGNPLIIHSMNKDSLNQLEDLFPGQFEQGTNRDDYDYIYNTQDLITLKGKKYHSKRNHINRFLEQDWSFEPINAENIEACKEMSIEWCRVNNCCEDKSKRQEQCAVSQSFKYYFELGYKGALIKLDNRIVAFTMGEVLNSDTFIVHIEKAFGDVQGAYPMINREFANYAAADLTYINREDDAGDEGLRKAKLSYRPAFMQEKYWVKFHD